VLNVSGNKVIGQQLVGYKVGRNREKIVLSRNDRMVAEIVMESE